MSDNQQQKQSLIFILILGALTAIGALSIDMFYLVYLKFRLILIQQLQMHN